MQIESGKFFNETNSEDQSAGKLTPEEEIAIEFLEASASPEDREAEPKNYSLLMIKPDAVEDNLEKIITDMVLSEGLSLTNRKSAMLDEHDVAVFYHESAHQPYFPRLVEYMTSGEVITYIVNGDNAVERLNKLVGATNPEGADRDTIRGKMGRSILINSVHSSNANRLDEEIRLVYKDDKKLLKHFYGE